MVDNLSPLSLKGIDTFAFLGDKKPAIERLLNDPLLNHYIQNNGQKSVESILSEKEALLYAIEDAYNVLFGEPYKRTHSTTKAVLMKIFDNVGDDRVKTSINTIVQKFNYIFQYANDEYRQANKEYKRRKRSEKKEKKLATQEYESEVDLDNEWVDLDDESLFVGGSNLSVSGAQLVNSSDILDYSGPFLSAL